MNEEQLPPQHRFAEQTVLGSLLRESRVFDEIALIVGAEDFYFDAHNKIFQAIAEQCTNGKPCDAATTFESLRKRGHAEDIGGAAYIAELLELAPTAASGEYYSRIVLDRARRRRVIHICGEIIRDAYAPIEDAADIVARFESRIFAVAENRGDEEAVPLEEAMNDVMDAVDRRQRGEKPDFIPTGLSNIDNILSGLKPGLTVVAARPSVGKSALAVKFLVNAVLQQHASSYLFSLEMPQQQVAARVLADYSEIPLNAISGASPFLPEYAQQIVSGAEIFRRAKAKIWIDRRYTQTVDTICATVRRAVRKHEVKLVAIDYLQLIDLSGAGSRSDNPAYRIGIITRKLKNLAMSMNIPIVLLSQLNRESTKRADGRPSMADLRESGNIEQDADDVILLWPREMEDPLGNKLPIQKIDAMVEKQRNGPTGIAPLDYVRRFTRFQDGAPSF